MTERTKQYEFNVNKNQIEKNGHYFALCDIVDAQKIVRELNEKDRQIKVEKFRTNALEEDNKMLNRMIDKRDGWNNLAHEQLFKLGKENEQLKQEYKKLKHKHGLLHDECLEQEIKIDNLKQWKKEVFDLIDKKIDEYQEYDGYDTEKYYIGTQLLKELKKELKGDDNGRFRKCSKEIS